MSQEPLDMLYPFLRRGAAEAPGVDAALLAAIAEKARETRETGERFFTEQGAALLGAARAIADAYRAGGRLFAMGNGGSSCDAAHVAVEFQHPVTTGRPALAAVNLAADMAMVSAVGNDLGFEHVFVRPLVALARRGDVLVGFSTSGNSANLVAAFAKARDMGVATVAFTGGDGGHIAAERVVDHCLVVRSDSIHRIQESHVVAYHILWDLVHTLLASR